MGKYVFYAPEQDWLLPPRVDEELGPEHLVFFLHGLVERLDLSSFEAEYAVEGRPAYPPQMLLKVWLYAYASGVTSSRRLEQKLCEDLGFRFLAGNLKPDFWTLNNFRKRHRRQLNDVFTQVLEAARDLGMGKLGRVAIDSTRIAANASPDRCDDDQRLRDERARLRREVRRWQQQCDAENPDDACGAAAAANWRQRLEEIPRQLNELRKMRRERFSARQRTTPERVSRTDPEARFQRKRGGYCLGYRAEIAVSDDHLIVAQRVHQAGTDAASLLPMTKLTELQCGVKPGLVVADSGYYGKGQIERVQAQGVAAVVPDAVLARELAGGLPAHMNARQQRRKPGLAEYREELRGEQSRAHLRRRKALVEPVFGVLKQQRGMRQFRCRGLVAVQAEWTLAALAYNLTRMYACRGRSH